MSKYLKSLGLVVVATLALVACSPKEVDRQDPKAVIEAIVQSKINGQYDELMKYVYLPSVAPEVEKQVEVIKSVLKVAVQKSKEKLDKKLGKMTIVVGDDQLGGTYKQVLLVKMQSTVPDMTDLVEIAVTIKGSTGVSNDYSVGLIQTQSGWSIPFANVIDHLYGRFVEIAPSEWSIELLRD